MSQQKLLKTRRPLEEVIERKKKKLSLKEGDKNRRAMRKYKQEARKMKKILVVAAVLVASLFLSSGIALATEISTSGDMEFKFSGTSQEGTASGLFGAGDVLINYGVTLTSGTFEANLTPKFNLADEALEVEEAYIKWMPDTLSVTMKPLGIDKELYDIEGNGGKPSIPSNPGLGIEIPVEPFLFDLVANNAAVGDTTKFGYALGMNCVIDSVTLEGLFGSSNIETVDWYGSYYGGQVSVDLAPLTIVGQYGTFSPEAAGLEDGNGYFGSVAYALAEELGTIALEYTGVDKNFNGAGTPTAKDYSKIFGEYSYPLTDAVSLTVDVASIEPGTGIDSYTEFGIKIGIAL